MDPCFRVSRIVRCKVPDGSFVPGLYVIIFVHDAGNGYLELCLVDRNNQEFRVGAWQVERVPEEDADDDILALSTEVTLRRSLAERIAAAEAKRTGSWILFRRN